MSYRIVLLCALVLIVTACVPTPTPGPTPTCNAWPTMWPTDIEGPDDWGTICPTSTTQPGVQANAYTVHGRVTVYESRPLEGAEIGVNRYADGVQTGLGIVWSDADGEFEIEVTGQVDALRIYVSYPPEFVPWGVTSGGVPRGLDVIHWEDPPENCGPIHWKAAWRWTPTVTATPSRPPTRTPTSSITPTVTQTNTPTVTPTATVFTIPTPPPDPPMPETMLGVAQESLRSQWRVEKVIYGLSLAVGALIAVITKMAGKGGDTS